MKTKILALLTVAVLAIAAASSFGQAPAPIVVPTPKTVTTLQPVTVTLSPAQVQELVAALAASGVTLPAGVRQINLSVVTTGSNAGGATVFIRF